MPQFNGSVDADNFSGSEGADTIIGAGGSDTLRGGAGNDVIFADQPSGSSPTELGAINLIYGDDGNDTLWGGVGKDWLEGGAGIDSVSGGAGDTLLGGDGDDWLSLQRTGSGATADGGAGDDHISLGGAADTLTGGAGRDIFVFMSGDPRDALGISTITDFNPADRDLIQFLGQFFVPNVFRGNLDNSKFSLKMGDVFSTKDYGSDVRQIWKWSDGAQNYLIFDSDGSRDLSVQDIVVKLSANVQADSLIIENPNMYLGLDGPDEYNASYLTGHYYGLGGDDVIRGSDGDDKLHGGSGNDTIQGGYGYNQIWGGDGDDRIDGGGYTTAVYSGASTDYVVVRLADGSVRVTDTRGIDGVDTLTAVYRLGFSDKLVALHYLGDSLIETAFKAVLRASSEAPSQLSAVMAISDDVLEGNLISATRRQIVTLAGATTSVASLAYEFFTGKVPGQSGIDYLVSPTGPNANNLNSAYYQSFNLENRYINFAVNLGKLGEGAAKFTADYGSLSLFDATKKAYAAIFGGTPTDAKVTALLAGGRDAYFATYGGDGLDGVGTKAAMVGWLLAEAQKADLGVMVRSNNAWLMDLSDGSAPFAIDILDPAKGYYKADFIFGGG